jgi:hypothetical protein
LNSIGNFSTKTQVCLEYLLHSVVVEIEALMELQMEVAMGTEVDLPEGLEAATVDRVALEVVIAAPVVAMAVAVPTALQMDRVVDSAHKMDEAGLAEVVEEDLEADPVIRETSVVRDCASLIGTCLNYPL